MKILLFERLRDWFLNANTSVGTTERSEAPSVFYTIPGEFDKQTGRRREYCVETDWCSKQLMDNHNWYVQVIGGAPYVYGYIKRRKVYLSRLIAKAPDGLRLHYRDGNSLNLRRDNLMFIATLPTEGATNRICPLCNVRLIKRLEGKCATCYSRIQRGLKIR